MDGSFESLARTHTATALFVRAPSARRRILDAARSLLLQEGYAGFSMEGVACRASVSRRTVYNQFDDREALYQASRAELFQQVEEALPFEIDTSQEMSVAVERFFTAALTVLASPAHRELLTSVLRDGRLLPWLRDRYAQSVDRPLRFAIERFILSLRVKGTLAVCDATDQAHRCLATLKAAAQAQDVAAFDAAELTMIFIRRIDCPNYYPQRTS